MKYSLFKLTEPNLAPCYAAFYNVYGTNFKYSYDWKSFAEDFNKYDEYYYVSMSEGYHGGRIGGI